MVSVVLLWAQNFVHSLSTLVCNCNVVIGFCLCIKCIAWLPSCWVFCGKRARVITGRESVMYTVCPCVQCTDYW